MGSPRRVHPCHSNSLPAERLGSVLKAAEIQVRVYGKGDSNHSRLNDDLGQPGDPTTQELYQFLDPLTGRKQ